MEKIIMNEKYGVTTYNEELKLVKIAWTVHCTSEEYRKAYNQIVDFQQKTTADYFISDIRDQKVVSPNDRKWFETTIIPRAIKQGLKKAAVISTESAFKKYYLNLILSTTRKFGLPLKIFSNETDAINWLTGKK